jgi:pimeloyl-ACP methyl ester carboxylesterase
MKKSLIILFIISIALIVFEGCSKHDDSIPVNTFVLVHGAWQGPYVWSTVKAQLESKGQKVIVVELPGHGADTTAPVTLSINAYRDKVVAAINNTTGKVILVGHSMGGVVVSAVAEQIPDRIKKLVYVGAFLPANGQSLLDLAFQDTQSLLGASLIPSADQLTLDIIRPNVVSIFCQDASDEIKNLVVSKFRVEPAIPFTNKAVLTDSKFGAVDKYYVSTLQDHAIGINLQNQMIAAAHINKVYQINTGHCPFLSKPDELVNIFLDIIK